MAFFPQRLIKMSFFKLWICSFKGKAKYSPTMGKFTRIMVAACQRPEEAFFVVLYSVLAPWQWRSYWICWQTDYTRSCWAARCTATRCAGRPAFTSGLLLFLAPNLWWAIVADLYPLFHKAFKKFHKFYFSYLWLCVRLKKWPFFWFLSHDELSKEEEKHLLDL